MGDCAGLTDCGSKGLTCLRLADPDQVASRSAAAAQDRSLVANKAGLAQQVVALTLGIALQAVFESGGPNARAQRALLADGLFRLLPAAA